MSLLEWRLETGAANPPESANARRRRVYYPVLGCSKRTVPAHPACFRHEALLRSPPDSLGTGDIAVSWLAGLGCLENVYAGFPDTGDWEDAQVVSCAFVHDFVGVGVAYQTTRGVSVSRSHVQMAAGGPRNPRGGFMCQLSGAYPSHYQSVVSGGSVLPHHRLSSAAAPASNILEAAV